jgi:hypothetical protein
MTHALWQSSNKKQNTKLISYLQVKTLACSCYGLCHTSGLEGVKFFDVLHE